MGGERFTKHRDRVQSKSGGWSADGKAVMHGYDIHEQLSPNITWMQGMILATTGRLYPKNVARLLEAIFVTTGYPDPRLWCNRVVTLAGSTHCPAVASLASGLASAEAGIYGGQSEYWAARTIQKAHNIFLEHGDKGLKIFVENQLKRHRAVFGFGRPVVHVEERIPPIEAIAAQLGILTGPHLLIARRIEKMVKKRRLIMNYGGYVIARLLDLGFSAREIYRILTLAFYNGLVPCYVEAFENEPGTFLPIACEDILYEGVGERPLP